MSKLSRFIYYYTDPDGERSPGNYEYHTASGPVVSFETNVNAPLRDLRAGIKLVQSGSGIPSQENLRPISGWTGLTVYHSGADTSDPKENPVSWQSQAGTVYGGTLDVTTGLLTVNVVDVSEAALSATATGTTGADYVQARFVPGVSFRNNANLLSDRFSTSYSSGTVGRMSKYTATGGIEYIYFNVPKSVLSSYDTAGVLAWIAEAHPQFVVQVADVDERTYKITPQKIRTLKGTNNIWVDTGDVTVTYPTK